MKIKQLEWSSFPDVSYEKAEAMGFNYYVGADADGAYWAREWFGGDEEIDMTFGTIEDAKSAVQADFERRIMECIEPEDGE